jgi:hypothetical protein
LFEGKFHLLQEKLGISSLEDYQEYAGIATDTDMRSLVESIIFILLDGSSDYYIRLFELAETEGIIDLGVGIQSESDKSQFYVTEETDDTERKKIPLRRPHKPFSFIVNTKDNSGSPIKTLGYTHKRIQPKDSGSSFEITSHGAPSSSLVHSELHSRMTEATAMNLVYYPEGDRAFLSAIGEIGDAVYPILEQISQVIEIHDRVMRVVRRWESHGYEFTKPAIPKELKDISRNKLELELLKTVEDRYVRGLLSIDLMISAVEYIRDVHRLLNQSLKIDHQHEYNLELVTDSFLLDQFYTAVILDRVSTATLDLPETIKLPEYNDTKLRDFFVSGPASLHIKTILKNYQLKFEGGRGRYLKRINRLQESGGNIREMDSFDQMIELSEILINSVSNDAPILVDEVSQLEGSLGNQEEALDILDHMRDIGSEFLVPALQCYTDIHKNIRPILVRTEWFNSAVWNSLKHQPGVTTKQSTLSSLTQYRNTSHYRIQITNSLNQFAFGTDIQDITQEDPETMIINTLILFENIVFDLDNAFDAFVSEVWRPEAEKLIPMIIKFRTRLDYIYANTIARVSSIDLGRHILNTRLQAVSNETITSGNQERLTSKSPQNGWEPYYDPNFDLHNILEEEMPTFQYICRLIRSRLEALSQQVQIADDNRIIREENYIGYAGEFLKGIKNLYAQKDTIVSMKNWLSQRMIEVDAIMRRALEAQKQHPNVDMQLQYSAEDIEQWRVRWNAIGFASPDTDRLQQQHEMVQYIGNVQMLAMNALQGIILSNMTSKIPSSQINKVEFPQLFNTQEPAFYRILQTIAELSITWERIYQPENKQNPGVGITSELVEFAYQQLFNSFGGYKERMTGLAKELGIQVNTPATGTIGVDANFTIKMQSLADAIEAVMVIAKQAESKYIKYGAVAQRDLVEFAENQKKKEQTKGVSKKEKKKKTKKSKKKPSFRERMEGL